MARNPSTLDNFKTYSANRFAICDVSSDAVNGMNAFEFSSGATVEAAKEAFYRRFMVRFAADGEMMLNAQRRGSLILQQITGGVARAVETNLLLIAA